MKKNSGADLWKKAKRLIPGGNQLLSKRPEMFLPEHWPAFYKRARGAEVWDLDGRRYYDFSIMAIGSCVLGYANLAVSRAVQKAVRDGSMSTLNCPEEVELAEKLIELHPWAQMARFARTGGEACSMAVRIARAASGKDKVLFCGYHGWTDWYISANIGNTQGLDGQLLPGLEPKGVPRSLANTAIPFSYGNIQEFNERVRDYPEQIGVIMMEVQRSQPINIPFLKEVCEQARRMGAVLIYDEVTSGFRMRAGGMHVLHDLEPDLVVLGKAMGNGHPIAAVVGKKNIMEAAQSTFISSTYWTERVGFAAALAVIQEFKKNKVAETIACHGGYIRKGLIKILSAHGIKADIVGLEPAPTIIFREEKPLLIKTLFTQEMLKRGFLASNLIYASIAHTPQISDRYLAHANAVMALIAKAKKSGNLEALLEGPVCHGGFQRLA